ncbi:Sir2 silent information regulator family NAD-dependent deacetylase [Clostridium sp. SHJSY1]|uniref:SIR2 family NAD-dependent protein deacylase n=1 Tax=Clostridium sp. SHJSY1 TaxID=2942483 RepID=UPI002876E8DA|nr:Sir2 silent information regulator family NAD-dependent deacetylase [Clostridium sp. SHJSY1]MDS0524310.1 Sir2 silent information regulator family NAD-dependent deacetylase [Clostridium sp. SHJSY1]
MKDYNNRIKKASEALKNAEYIFIGAGAGLSDAAGLKYSGKRFTDKFTDFIEKYDMEDLYTSSFYLFETMEEKWAYWARHISLNRFETPATKLYKKLYQLINKKKYFVLTTNVEHQFWKAGFSDEKIFATQGDYGYIQCAIGCHKKLYDNEMLVQDMLMQTRDCKIPSELVPKCPVCGGDMDVNVRKDKYFIQDEAWDRACNNYGSFLKEIEGKKVVFMELGVGFNTPGIIRYPFEQITYANSNATLIRLNRDYPDGPDENKDKTIAFDEDMMKIIIDLLI